MSKLVSICLLFLALTLSFGCVRDNTNVQPDILPTIDDEFNVEIWEHLTPEGSVVSLLVQTIDDQDCLNTIIKNEVTSQGNLLIVNLDGIGTPANCEVGLAPAEANIHFDNLRNGSYDLELNILSLIKNEGTIAVSPESLTLELTTTDGIHISNNTLNRIPNNLYWGYIALDRMELPTINSIFLEQLNNLKDDFSLDKGNYGHFKILENNSIPDFEVSTVFPDSDKFVFKYSGDEGELAKLIKDFRENTAFLNKLEIKVMTYEGLEL